jgi:transposase-like protein
MSTMRKWRRHTIEFKRAAVEQMKTAGNITALARELGIQQKLLYSWKYQFEGRPEPRHANLSVNAEDRKDQQHRAEIARLKAAIADKALEVDFLKSALLRVNQAQPMANSGELASTKPSNRGSRSKAH